MVELDSAQREARAREVRHDVVAQLTAGTQAAFRILFAAQWLNHFFIRLPVSKIAFTDATREQAAA